MLKLDQEVNIFGYIGAVSKSSRHGFYIDFCETELGHSETCRLIAKKYDPLCSSFYALVNKHSEFDGLYNKATDYCIFSECPTLEYLEKFIKILTGNKINTEISIF